jgi:hypothetical protein
VQTLDNDSCFAPLVIEMYAVDHADSGSNGEKTTIFIGTDVQKGPRYEAVHRHDPSRTQSAQRMSQASNSFTNSDRERVWNW